MTLETPRGQGRSRRAERPARERARRPSRRAPRGAPPPRRCSSPQTTSRASRPRERTSRLPSGQSQARVEDDAHERPPRARLRAAAAGRRPAPCRCRRARRRAGAAAARAWRRCARARDPARIAARGGDAAVERHRHLQQHEGPAAPRGRREARVEPRASASSRRRRHLDPGATQQREARAAHERVRVAHGRHHARDARRARRGAQGGVRPWCAQGSRVT